MKFWTQWAGIKLVPRDLILTPLMVAVWFCDDGTNNLKQRVCRFSTIGFSHDDCEFLSDSLCKFSIKSYLNRAGEVVVRCGSYERFIDLVKPHVSWSCFQYKLVSRSTDKDMVDSRLGENIIQASLDGLTQQQIGDKYDCNRRTVSGVLRRRLGAEHGIALKNKSGVTGVWHDSTRNKYVASVFIGGKKKCVGRFLTLVEAAQARKLYCELANDNGTVTK